MKTAKKVVAVIVMVLSAVLLLVMLASIAGTWWGQGQLKGVVTNVSASADNILERTQGAAGQINTVVSNSQGRVDEAVATIQNAGATVEETNLVLAAAEKVLDTDLTPAVERINERVSDTRDTIAIIDQTISLWKRLPGARDNELLAKADELIGKVKALQQAVADLRANIQAAKSRVTTEAVNKLTTPLNRVSTALGSVSSDLTTFGQRIDEERAQLAALTSQVLTWITVGAVVLTLAFLWMALAQFGLFVHAYGVFTGRDPLARWHKGKESDGTAPAPQATGAGA
ncbi:MAG: hypothetical protein ACM30E_01035 [Nitrososphaerales archaeon]